MTIVLPFKRAISLTLSLLLFMSNTLFAHSRQTASFLLSQQSRTIYQIQDIHLNDEAQQQIAATLKDLIAKKNLATVFVEGAFTEVNLNPFQTFQDQDAVRTTTNNLLAKKEISGALHALLTSHNPKIKIFGIDDEDHYNANVNAYRKSRSYKSLAQKTLSDFETRLNTDSQQSSDGFRLAVRTRNQHADFLSHVTNLIAHTKLSNLNEEFQSVKKYVEACRLEKQLDLARSKQELISLTQALLSSMSPNDRMILTSYLKKDATPTRYLIDWIFKQSQRYKINTAQYASLSDYHRYLQLSSEVDGVSVFKFVAQMEKNLLSDVAGNKAEKELATAYRQLDLARRLVDFALTREEWEEYKEVRKGEESVRKVRQKSAIDKISDLSDFIELIPFEDFYREAEKREDTMVRTIKANIPAYGNIAIVTGGFHADSLKSALQSPQIHIQTITPTVSKIETGSESAYLSQFAQKQTPLIQLFSQRQLFLSLPFWTPRIKMLLNISLLKGAPWPYARHLFIVYFYERFVGKNWAFILTTVTEELIYGLGAFSLFIKAFHPQDTFGFPIVSLQVFSTVISLVFSIMHSAGNIGLDAKQYYSQPSVILKLFIFRVVTNIPWMAATVNPIPINLLLAFITSLVIHMGFYNEFVVRRGHTPISRTAAPAEHRTESLMQLKLSILSRMNHLGNTLTSDEEKLSLIARDLERVFQNQVRIPIWGLYNQKVSWDQMPEKMAAFSELTEAVLSVYITSYLQIKPKLYPLIVPALSGDLANQELTPTSTINVKFFFRHEETPDLGPDLKDFMTHLEEFIFDRMRMRPELEIVDKAAYEANLNNLQKQSRNAREIGRKEQLLLDLLNLESMFGFKEEWPNIAAWREHLLTDEHRLSATSFLMDAFHASKGTENFWAAIHGNEINLVESLGGLRTYELLRAAQKCVPEVSLITEDEHSRVDRAKDFLKFLSNHVATTQSLDLMKDDAERTPASLEAMIVSKNKPELGFDSNINAKNRRQIAEALLDRVDSGQFEEKSIFANNWDRYYSHRSPDVKISELAPVALLGEYFERAETIALTTRRGMMRLNHHLASSRYDTKSGLFEAPAFPAYTFDEQPQEALEFLKSLAISGSDMTVEDQEALQAARLDIQSFLRTPTGNKMGLEIFDQIMDSSHNISKLMWTLSELNILNELFTDWHFTRNIGAPVDSKHVFAIDTHALKALEILENIPTDKFIDLEDGEDEPQKESIKTSYKAVRRRGDLKLARYIVLFHDAAKPNWRHSPHSELDKITGYDILPRVLASSSLSGEQRDLGGWTISRDAMYSTLHLPGSWKTAGQLNRNIVTYTTYEILSHDRWDDIFNSLPISERGEFLLKRFDLIHLLTYCDNSAVVPGLRNSKSWQYKFLQTIAGPMADLREELSQTTKVDKDFWNEWTESARLEMMRLIRIERDSENKSRPEPVQLSDEQIAEFFDYVHPEFWRTEKPKTIYDGVKNFFDPAKASVSAVPPATFDNPYTFFFSVDEDRPLLLAQMAGILTAHEWNIQIAGIETGQAQHHVVIDKFKVAPLAAIGEGSLEARVGLMQQDLRALLAGETTMEQIFKSRSSRKEYLLPIHRIEGRFIDDSAKGLSVLETTGEDFPGYLHLVSRILAEVFDCNIVNANLNNRLTVHNTFVLTPLTERKKTQVIDAFDFVSSFEFRDMNPDYIIHNLKQFYGKHDNSDRPSSGPQSRLDRFLDRIRDFGLRFLDAKKQSLKALVASQAAGENPYQLSFVSELMAQSPNLFQQTVGERFKHLVLVPENEAARRYLESADRSFLIEKNIQLSVLEPKARLFKPLKDGKIQIDRAAVELMFKQQLPAEYFDAASSLHVILPANAILTGNGTGLSVWKKAVLYLTDKAFKATVIDWQSMQEIAAQIAKQS